MDIVIVTSIQLFGDALASYLKSRPDVTVLAIAQSFSLLRNFFSESHVDLGLVDVTQGIALDEVRSIASQYPAIALLALGLKAEQKDVMSCGRAGFAGYVSRDASLEKLVQAMEDAINGRLSCPPEVAGELLRALYRDHREPVEAAGQSEALTPRECDVLRELGNGLSNKEIARELGLSVATIKHHVHRVLEKLQVVRRAEAMRKVRDTPWIAGPTSAGGNGQRHWRAVCRIVEQTTGRILSHGY